MHNGQSSSESDLSVFEANLDSDITLKSIEELLIPAQKPLKSIRGKDLILFIGKTGSGKSTLINYLKGIDMELYCEREDGQAVMVPKNKEEITFAEVGYGARAQTFYPQAIEYKNNYIFVDCPGWEDNRGPAHEICASVLTQLAVKSAAHVKGVIACIEESDLDLKATNCGKFFDALLQLFSDFEQAKPFLYLAVTKTENKPYLKTSHILKRIESYQINEETNLNKLEETIIAAAKKGNVDENESLEKNIKRQEIKARVATCEAIRSKLDTNIFIVNLMENRSRKEILTKVDTLVNSQEAISESIFRIPNNTSNLQYFYNLIDRTALNFSFLIANKEAETSKLNNLEESLKNKRIELANQQGRLERVKKSSSLINNYGTVLDGKVKSLQAVELELKKLVAYQKDVQNEIKKLSIKKASLDCADPVEFWASSKQFSPNPVAYIGTGVAIGAAALGAFVAFSSPQRSKAITDSLSNVAELAGKVTGNLYRNGHISMEKMPKISDMFPRHQFDYDEGVPFIEHKTKSHCDHGYLSEQIRDSEAGEYKVTFYPNPYITSTAEAEVYVAKRDVPVNKRSIKELEHNIKKLTVDYNKSITDYNIKLQQKAEDEQNIKKLQEQIKTLKEQINKSGTQSDNGIKDKERSAGLIKDIEADIMRFKNEILQLETDIKATQANIKITDENFKKRKKVFYFVAYIAEIAKYDENGSIKEFIAGVNKLKESSGYTGTLFSQSARRRDASSSSITNQKNGDTQPTKSLGNV